MRTTTLSLVAALSAMLVASCTVKDVDTPPLAGPSSMARTIVMTADKDTLVQDGLDQVTITLRSVVQPGQSDNVRLRAQVFVDGVAQDFGTLSNKSPIATAAGTTIVYRAPAASTTAAGQVATTVTIGVTPDDSGDFRSEVARQIDLRLIPPGVIQPINPNLVANFTFTPTAPKVLDVVVFDANTTTNNAVACGQNCSYAWSFGDNTTGSGISVTHQYRAVGTFLVTLTVTDSRGATATSIKSVIVAPGTPPGATFTATPTAPAVNQDVFFDASGSNPAPGRTIVTYAWSFGDGNSGSGVVTAHRYTVAGTFPVILTTTDDAGAVGRSSATTITVGQAASGPAPTASLTFLPDSPKPGQPVAFNASGSRPGQGSNIVSYTFNWGDGSADEVVTNPLQTHSFPAGTYVVTLTVTDSLGRTATAQVTVEVAP